MNIQKNQSKVQRKITQLIEENESSKQAARITKIFLRNITESLPQFLFWKDVNSVYLGCNKNYAQLLGLNSPDEIIGKTDHDLVWQPTGHTTEAFQKGDQDTIAGHHITNQEETLALPNGKTIITLVSKLPIMDSNKVIGIVGYFTDITEIKNKEKELVKARLQAEAANQAKSTFIANISHDIRTPLTGMIGMANIISKRLNNGQEKEAANNLYKAGNMLLELLNQVIEITKLDSGTLPAYEMNFSLQKIINDLIMLFTPSTQDKKLRLIVQHDETIPNHLIGDQTRIHRILLNLISNAIKFTEHGSITIITNLVKQKKRNIILKISVKDTGIGIPLDKQKIIFSRFTRLTPAYEGNHQGFGLGLSIVKQLISEIDGEIYVSGEEGRGSIFTCVIPLKQALLEEPESRANLDIGTDSQTNFKTNSLHPTDSFKSVENKVITAKKHNKKFPIKSLLVEDNKLAQIVAKNLLEEFHCQVDVAGTAEEAINLFGKNQYSLIFMDIGLPGKNGCEASMEMRQWEKETNRHTPIIALTAHIDQDNKQKCLDAGMDMVLTKPLTSEHMQSVLNTFMRQKAKKASSYHKRADNSTHNTLKSIDLELGAQIVGGDQTSAKELLEMFINTIPEIGPNLTIFYNKQNWDQLRSWVHKLHGGACYCGVPRLKALAKNLEDNLKLNKTIQIAQGYKDLIAEINNVLKEYKQV